MQNMGVHMHTRVHTECAQQRMFNAQPSRQHIGNHTPSRLQHRMRCRGALIDSVPTLLATLPPSADVHEALQASMHTAPPDALLQQSTQLLTTLAEAATEDDRYSGVLSPLVDGLESVLKTMQTGLEAVGVSYAYGWSIVALTVLVKVLTYPFTKQQIESAMAVQSLKPQIDTIKARYGADEEAIRRETKALYEKAGVNPLAGCLPVLATLPIYFALYRSLSNVSKEGLLGEGFFWLPSLAGPTSLAAQAQGTGTAWLYPFVDGAPPIGWDGAAPYLVLPVLLVIAQWASSAVLSPIDPNDENAKTQTAIVAGLPLLIGYFSLNVPSGLSLYYFANSIFTTAISIYLKKLGGANVSEFDLGPLELGQGRRRGPVVQPEDRLSLVVATGLTDQQAAFQDLQAEAQRSSAAVMNAVGEDGEAVAASSNTATEGSTAAVISKRCRRRKVAVA